MCREFNIFTPEDSKDTYKDGHLFHKDNKYYIEIRDHEDELVYSGSLTCDRIAIYKLIEIPEVKEEGKIYQPPKKDKELLKTETISLGVKVPIHPEIIKYDGIMKEYGEVE